MMETKIYKNPSAKECELLGEKARHGELIAIPTETVYGLGANALDETAISRIYEAKGRPSDNPLILHVPDMESIKPLVKEITPTAKKLMETFWPGPLTITMPKSDLVPDRATGGLPNVALRCPDHKICHDFLKAAGVPIAAPSANISGRPSPTTAEEVYNDMSGRIEAIIDAGPCDIGVESTVVECGDDEVVILRPGGITEEDLKKVVSKVTYDKGITTGQAPKAPGMKYKHYAPDATMKTYVGTEAKVTAALVEQIVPFLTNHEKVGLLLSEEVWESLEMSLDVAIEDRRWFNWVKLITYGSRQEPDKLAHCLYSSLLEFNNAKVKHILAEGVEPKGVGVAIMNRMEKSSSHQVFYLK